jgi:16S rRNA (guanine527-N7)-methyltransferase
MTSEGRDLLRTCAAELSIALGPEQLSAFASLYTELQKWNRKINLTAIRDERNIVLKHFIDSLTLLGLLDGVHAVLDLGSGGGFPILPLKIMVPELAAVSVDAVEKKILFQRHAARLLGLREFSALHVRGEHLKQDFADSFDCVVSRAFPTLATLQHWLHRSLSNPVASLP